MPCSGKTTVERILAGHPAVQAAGELTRLADVATTVHDFRKQLVPYPEYVPSLDPVSRPQLGQAYLAGLPAPPAGKTRVTDRAASNFWYAGLIHLLLPQAKIIHVTGDPIDTALACFARLFAFGHPFCYDLAELGRRDRRYRRLMDLWRSVLPPGVMLEVAFEDVVENVQWQAQRLLEHCGLPWDDRCLNVQPAGTAGKAGERQPLDPARWGAGGITSSISARCWPSWAPRNDVSSGRLAPPLARTNPDEGRPDAHNAASSLKSS